VGRRLLNLLTLMSLLLFVLFAVACARSHLVWREYLKWGEADGLTWHRVVLRLGRGQVGVAFERVAFLPPVPDDVISAISDEHGNFRTGGLTYGRVDPRNEMTRQLTTFWRRQGFYFVFRRDRRPEYLYREAGSTYYKQPKVETRFIADTPYWPLLLLGATPPALHILRTRRRRRRVRATSCERCGYDLRATPGRCPECGHVPAGATA
jgi:hypothetical protein